MNQAVESVEVHRCRMDCCWGPSNHHGIIVGDPQVNVNLGWLGGTRACWCSLLIHLALQATEVHGIHRPAQPDPAPLGSSQDGKWHIFQAIKQQNLQQKYNKHLQTSPEAGIFLIVFLRSIRSGLPRDGFSLASRAASAMAAFCMECNQQRGGKDRKTPGETAAFWCKDVLTCCALYIHLLSGNLT